MCHRIINEKSLDSFMNSTSKSIVFTKSIIKKTSSLQNIKCDFLKVFCPIVCQGKRVAAIFHLSTTTRAKQIESIVSRHCWNSFSHFIRFSLNWLKTCAKYFKMLQLAFTLLFIFSSRNSRLLKLV